MLGQNFITRTRRLFDRALTSLPVTQHERVWPLYLKVSERLGRLAGWSWWAGSGQAELAGF